MNKEFIPYELALKLKELGFDEKCFDVYNDVKSKIWFAPRKRTPKILFQQAFRFFREKYSAYCHIKFLNKDKGLFYGGYIDTPDAPFGESIGSNFKTYEEAELACLKKLIEIAEKS